MASTFTTFMGTASFTAMVESWSEQTDAAVDVIGFPGGDSVAISIAGVRETRRSFTALFSSVASFRFFRQMMGKEGWLTIEFWDTGPQQAVLTNTSPSVPWQSGELSCRVSFILY